MADTRLIAQVRARGGAHHLRREGLIPAVVYGRRRESQALAVDGRAFIQLLNLGINTLIRLEIDGQEDAVMIKDLQRHPVRGNITHVDFLAVALDEVLRTSVPVLVSGDDIVAQNGGILQHLLREVEVECLPTDVPSSVVVDVSHLRVGDHVTVADLTFETSVTLLTPADELIASVAAPRMAEVDEVEDEEDEEVAAADAAEKSEDQQPVEQPS